MREYSKVGPQFWSGRTGKALKAQGPEAVIVALYLMTCQHANMLGLYYLNRAYIAADTGLPLEGALKGLQGACEAGFCYYDDESEIVWVIEMALYQVADQLEPKDNRCKGIQREYDALPENPYLAAFYKRYAGRFHMATCRGKGEECTRAIEGPSNPLQSQEQEQEQEQEHQEQASLRSAPSSAAQTDRGDSDLTKRQAAKLAQLTDEAVATFNASALVKPQNGLLATVHATVGRDKRRADVRRVTQVAREICQDRFGNAAITVDFWEDYWAAAALDDHTSGRAGGGKDHPTWLPDFEYLTRAKTMLKVFERTISDGEAA